ncbi:MAG: gliding motility-associated C-terminal domain-containing protein [Crocinitomicaceae bacterium]|nr:gliding motility-associated C-terminal domain-containing protein [Flavobacteriales bacterium]NQZ38373.1 gliding motility-associated C-terminal domain-containing protein [Crocinitomicaceae bacterium]
MNGKLPLFQEYIYSDNQPITSLNSIKLRIQKIALLLGVLSFSAFGFSQTGPAGINSGIRLWLDASDLDGDGIIEGMLEAGVSAGDSTITEWRDKSGAVTEPTHFTLPTAGLIFTDTPRYSPLEPNFDGHTVVDFNSNSGLIHELAASWNGAHTVFIVFKQKTALVSIGTSIFSSGIDDPALSNFDDHFRISSDSATSGTQFAYYTSSNTPASPDGTENIFGLQSAAQNVTFYTVTRTAGATDVTTYVDGLSPNTSTTFPADGMVFDQYFLNGNRDTTLLNDCYIAEVIVYDEALTGEALQRIHDYLNCKYITSFAGPGPGGIDPCNVSLWLKADSLNLAPNGIDVNDWYDLSSYGYDAVQSGNRPDIEYGDNNFNPSLNFNGGNGEHLFINNSPTTGFFDGLTMGVNPFSFYSVAKVVPNLSGTLIADNLCTGTSGYRVFYSQSNGEWNFDGTSRDGAFSEISSTSLVTDTAETAYSLISFKREGSNNTLQTQDGDIATGTTSPVLSLTPLTGTNSPTERWVGKRSNSGGCNNNYFDGNISEIIIVRSSVTVEEDKKIQSYLGLKYGLTIPSSLGNYVAGNGSSSLWTFGSHWYDVAGLGEDTLSTLDQRISKSQNPSAIVTMSTDSDFTSDNSTARPVLGHGNYLVWGNNNVSAASALTLTGAPTDYAILPINWRVKKSTGTPDVYVQVDANSIPSFVGDLYLVQGPGALTMASPVMLTETSMGSGIWETSSAVNFVDNAFFTFAVRNDLIVEFSTSTSASVDEETMGSGPNSFPDVIATGIVNVTTFIDVNEVGGTADNTVGGADYTYTDANYTLNTGTYSSDIITLTPPTLDGSNQDLIDEGLETAVFQIILGPGVDYGDVNASGGAPAQLHTMTITDDDSYQIEIGNPVNGAENGASVTFDIFVAGGGNNTSGSVITGVLTYSGGTAIEGTDFQSTGATTFIIGIGVASTTVTLTVDDDSFLEGTETVLATIASSVGAIASVSTATANIIDDEETNLQISIGSAVDAAEDGGTLQFTVSLGAGVSNQTGAAITGDVTYGTGVAISGTDFTTSGIFSIANGAGIGLVTATVSPDDLVEPTESVIAIISNPSIGGAGAIHATFFTDTAYISDEDSANLEISITAPIATVLENLVAGSFDYLIQMDDNKFNGTGGNITGTVTLTGSATPSPSIAADYTNVSSFNFTIPDGSNSVTVSIVVIDDGDIEPLETVIANISGLSHGVADATNNNTTVTIIDDDAGGIFISIGSPTDTTEGPASPGLPFISFEVFIEGGALNTTGAPITGNITYSGSAQDGPDYTSAPSFSIPPLQNSTTVTLDVIDDPATEPTETVNAFLVAGVGSPSTGTFANTTTTMNILDDDASFLTISVGSPVNGAEGTVDGAFTVFLDGGAFNGTGTAITGTITYGGTADPSNDFVTTPIPLPVTFSIPNGDFQAVIALPVFDDQAVEFTEDLIAVISAPSVGTVSANDSVTVNITDNDAGSLLISIDTLTNPNGTEGVSGLSFIVSMGGGLTNGLGQDLTGTLTYDGTATPSGIDADFDSPIQFAIPDGSSSQPLTLGVFQDLFIEQTESVIVSISSPVIGTISASDTATALIFDDNNLIELEIAVTSDGIEIPPIPGALDVEFAVSLAGGLVNQLGTDITGTLTYSGTATGGGIDYSESTIFTIPNTLGSTTVPVTVIDDIEIEATETVIATIATTSIGSIGSSSSAEAKILDDDTDTDNDGLPDLLDPDNDIYGPGIYNIDSDCDGIFDGCDVDADGDGINDDGGIDLDGDGFDDVYYYAVPLVDTDGDGIEDGCDADLNGPDENGDGLSDLVWPIADFDEDLLPDHVDPNDNNIDTDGDGTTDGADYIINGNGTLLNGCDSDGDGIHNEADADFNPGSPDEDGDGIIAQWDMSDVLFEGQQINYIVSPNGDGVNETLIIQGIQVVDRHELIIFNRYGEPIYINEDYNNDWAGQVNQDSVIGTDMLDDGVYYYTLDVGNGKGLIRGYIEIRK